MPDERKHTCHAQHNIDFLSTFNNSLDYHDWIITVCFYISVHIIEAIIARIKLVKIQNKEYKLSHSDELRNLLKADEDNKFDSPLSPHKARQIIINYNFPGIRDEYYNLYNRSRTARYIRYAFSLNDVSFVLQRCLKRIISWSEEEYKTKYNIRDM